MCFRCQAGMGEPCSQPAGWLLALGALLLALGLKLLPPQLHAVRGCHGIAALAGRVLPACWPRGDSQEQFGNLFSRVTFDSKVKWKLWEVGSVFPAVFSQGR